MRRGIGVTGLGAAVLLALGSAGQTWAQTVSTPAGGKEVPSAHGRSWIAVPDPLITIRMDANGNITGSAAPIAVAHEESGAFCGGVVIVSATPSNKQPQAAVSFPSPGRCNVDASAASLVLPMDSAKKYGQICNAAWRTTTPPPNCSVDAAGKVTCTPYMGPDMPMPMVGDAWRRAEGWTGKVAYGGIVQVVMVYSRFAPEMVGNLITPTVQLTCDKVPCVTFSSGTALPQASVGKAYRAQLFSGAVQPVTIDTATAPPGLAVGQDGYLSGTPTKPGLYEVRLSFTDSRACPWNMWTMLSKGGNSKWSNKYQLSVRDVDAPVVAGFTSSPDTVPFTGGNVVVTVQASDNVGVARVVSSLTLPSGSSSPGTLTRSAGSETSGTWTATLPIPPNAGTSAATVTIRTSAFDAANNEGRASAIRTVVVRASPPLRESIQPPGAVQPMQPR